MEVREAELPGIGMKFSFESEEGETICVVIHKTGRREIYRFLPGHDTPDSVIELSDQEARELGAILIGTHFQPDVQDTARLVMKELTIEWLKVPADSPLAGKSIQENRVRKLTGATIIAVFGPAKKILNPGPDTLIASGDTVVVIGEESQVRQFQERFRVH
ncbi:MAG: cation:proton antiporter regulatory subunit [Candidatus Bipolaricaulota bacterium]|nr:cation:proton antiporter regulatory subunit [Candidatus Bipolaricaulota bacterium]MCS7273826.1 cation:proton antiporter regulatory subunit [Candidatus Bipolaricaulota bacterium]MDW8110756.1 cation:proton antiporter regulatory subunit [Candidatus Bipolaricaulota bacterium]MDW8328386.1 cation:proton antiporter regulatory subunit [Candidatus Bipolaricaulota bacterium]